MQADQPSTSAMDSSQRVAMLRKRLDEYNSAISKAMGHSGAANTNRGRQSNTNHHNTYDDDEDIFIDDSTLEKEVWNSIHKNSSNNNTECKGNEMADNAAFRRFMEPQNVTASRSLFPDAYRGSSQMPSHNLPQFDEETDEEEDDDEFSDCEENDEDDESNDIDGREWWYGDNTKGPTTVGVRPTTADVERCLSSELRDSAESIARSLPKPDSNVQPSLSSVEGRSLGETVLLANTIIASSVTSPEPNIPVYSITDLENAFYRLQTIEQSLKHLSSFSEQDPKLPFADRLVQLRQEREELLVKDGQMRKKNSLQDASLIKIAQCDNELHKMIQDLINQCDSAHNSFVPIYARKAVIVQREELLRSKTEEMRKLYDSLQFKKQHVQNIHMSNKAATLSLASRKEVLAKEKDLVKSLEAANSEKISKLGNMDNRVKNWVAVLEERDRGLKAKEQKMLTISTELKKRMDTVESQKENQIIAHQNIVNTENQSATQVKGVADQLKDVPWYKNDL
eukprot:Tbor_TRINITY_DN5477_c0_g3::TRINITY_DN5477_c0_g3_i2::g.25435::m.25435